MKDLSESERKALETLKERLSIMIYTIPDKTGKDFFGNPIPGIVVYKKLEKRGLCIICEPIVDDDGFEWSPAVEITAEGQKFP